MSERTGYNPGEFCWVDLATTDIDAATAFYCDLLGCQAQSAGPVEQTGGYGFFMLNGKMTAGYGPVQMPGQPPAWSSYVSVADADETVAKVAPSGGKVVVSPMDLPMEAGRMAVLQDAEGAYICAIQQNTPGAQLVNEVGTWTWNQLGSRDLDKAAKFYGGVFGWRADQAEAAQGMPYFMWQVEGQRWPEGLAGAMDMNVTSPPEVPPHWMVYFSVADADVAVDKTVNAGGKVIAPVIEIPVGRMAVLVDPQGATFAIIESHYQEAR